VGVTSLKIWTFVLHICFVVALCYEGDGYTYAQLCTLAVVRCSYVFDGVHRFRVTWVACEPCVVFIVRCLQLVSKGGGSFTVYPVVFSCAISAFLVYYNYTL
jgi:hypothetical protein